jgi:hypothetical protein
VNDLKLIPAVKNGDLQALRQLLDGGANVGECDEHGWTPLAWAAGRGDVESVTALLAAGADVAATGRDNRTPLMIAKAAGRDEVFGVLVEAERRAGVWKDPLESVQYCKAFLAKELRAFPQYANGTGPLAELGDDDIVYLHQDYTVTRSMWHGEDVLIDNNSTAWKSFCVDSLTFRVPDDLL